MQSLYEEIVEELNQNFAQYEKLKRVLVIHAELSIEDGTLTPSMKLRRRHLEERYKKEIDALYADAQPCEGFGSRKAVSSRYFQAEP